MCPIKRSRRIFFPLTPFVIKQIGVPGDGVADAQALRDDFSKGLVCIMELLSLTALKDSSRSIGSLFIICCQHVDPNDDDCDVYRRMFFDQYLLHRPGAAQTRSSCGRDQNDESEFIFVGVEVFSNRVERRGDRNNHFVILLSLPPPTEN